MPKFGLTSAKAGGGTRFPVLLFLLGIGLRLPGLLLNGMSDLYQLIVDWGASVHHAGLVETFGIGYGILSYAAFGAAESAAEWMPRFWWAPYKLLVIVFDAGVCLALLALVSPRERRWLLVLVWLNPWFILHGAYHGFWDGPHLLMGLLAVLALRRLADERQAWAVAGGLLGCSAMFKPQGLFHFVGPVALYLAVQYLRGTRRPLMAFALGASAVAAIATLSIWAAGGSAFALYHNYDSASTVMANLSNGGLGLWRFLTWMYMEWTGQPGQVYELRVSASALAAWKTVSAAICVGILVAFALRLGIRRGGVVWIERSARSGWFTAPATAWPAPDALFACLTLGALVISQFGPHAHIHHSYAAIVLLTVWALRDRALARLWVALVLMFAVAHVSTFGLGDARLLLPPGQPFLYPHGAPLVDRILELPAYQVPDALLTFQSMVLTMPVLSAKAVSLMSSAVFLVASGIIWRILRILPHRSGVLLAGRSSAPAAPAGS